MKSRSFHLRARTSLTRSAVAASVRAMVRRIKSRLSKMSSTWGSVRMTGSKSLASDWRTKPMGFPSVMRGQKFLALSVHVDVIHGLPDLTQGWIPELELLLEFPQPVFYIRRMDCQSWDGSPTRQGPATEIAFVFADRRIGLFDRGLRLILG